MLRAFEGGGNAGGAAGIEGLSDRVPVGGSLGRVRLEIEPAMADLLGEASLERVFLVESLVAENFAKG